MSERPQNKNLKPFKPGQSGNPAGKPKGTLSSAEVSALMGKFCKKSRVELQAIIQDEKSTMLEIMVASVMAKAAKDGDYARLAFLLDRSVGKVKEEIEQTVRSISDEDLDKIPRDALIKLVSGQK